MRTQQVMKPGICFFLLLICSRFWAQGQLLQNYGFESHGTLKCVDCYELYGQYPSVVYHWDNGGWACRLWDKTVIFLDKTVGIWSPFPRIQPHAGNCMVEMRYNPKINGVHGGASHLTAQSLQLLEVGKTYEVSFYLYIDSVKNQDPEWAKHIGIALLPEKISFNNLSGTSVIPNLPIDTVVYNRWYQVKWRVRPLCNSQYLMIGVLRSKTWPSQQTNKDVFYYVDDFSLLEISAAKVVQDSSSYYCSQYDPLENPELKPQLDKLLLFFDSNVFSLSDAHKHELKLFAQKASRYPKLSFDISGHTDSIGSDNAALAQNRIQSVLSYLVDSLQMSRHRFLEIPCAARAPLASNAEAPGRAQNRRVEVSGSNFEMPMVWYRKAIAATVAGNKAEAYVNLNKWLRSISTQEHLSIQFDPRFESLKYKNTLIAHTTAAKTYNKRWLQLLSFVGTTYKPQKNPPYNRMIDSLHLEYLRVTGKLGMVLDCYTGFSPYADSLTLHIPALSKAEIELHNKVLFQAMQPMLNKLGWPKRSTLGSDGARVAFGLIYRGADVPTLQTYLPKLKKLCDNGEADWLHYAMLYDRCQILDGHKQHYGTQYEIDPSGNIDVMPWSGDKDTINARRKAIGLPELPLFLQEIMFFE